MDLNSAIHTAEHGGFIRNDELMRPGWSIRWVAEKKLLYYFNSLNDRMAPVYFNDAHRASFQWRTTLDGT